MTSRFAVWLTSLGLFLLVSGAFVFLLWAPVDAAVRFFLCTGLVVGSIAGGLTLERARPRTIALQMMVSGALLFPLVFHLGVEAGYLQNTGATHRVVFMSAALDLILWALSRRVALAYLGHLSLYLAFPLWIDWLHARSAALPIAFAALALAGLWAPHALKLTDRTQARPFWAPGLLGLGAVLWAQVARGDQTSLGAVAWAWGLGGLALAPFFPLHGPPEVLGRALLPVAMFLTLRPLGVGDGGAALAAALLAVVLAGRAASDSVTRRRREGAGLAQVTAVVLVLSALDLPAAPAQWVALVALALAGLGLLSWASRRPVWAMDGTSAERPSPAPEDLVGRVATPLAGLAGPLLLVLALDQLGAVILGGLGMPPCLRLVAWMALGWGLDPAPARWTLAIAVLGLVGEFSGAHRIPGLVEGLLVALAASLYGQARKVARAALALPLDSSEVWPLHAADPLEVRLWRAAAGLTALAAFTVLCERAAPLTLGLTFALGGLVVTATAHSAFFLAISMASVAFAQGVALVAEGAPGAACLLFAVGAVQGVLARKSRIQGRWLAALLGRPVSEWVEETLIVAPLFALAFTLATRAGPWPVVLFGLALTGPLVAVVGLSRGALLVALPAWAWLISDPMGLLRTQPVWVLGLVASTLGSAWVISSRRVAHLVALACSTFALLVVALYWRGPDRLEVLAPLLLSAPAALASLALGRAARPLLLLQLAVLALREGTVPPVTLVIIGLAGIRVELETLPLLVAWTAVAVLGAQDLVVRQPHLAVTLLGFALQAFASHRRHLGLHRLAVLVLAWAFVLARSDLERAAVAAASAVACLSFWREESLALAFLTLSCYSLTRGLDLPPITFGLVSLALGLGASLVLPESQVAGGLAVTVVALLADSAWHPEVYQGSTGQPALSLALVLAGAGHLHAWSQGKSWSSGVTGAAALLIGWILGLDALRIDALEVYLVPLWFLAVASAKDELPVGSFRRDELSLVGFALLFVVSYIQSLPAWGLDDSGRGSQLHLVVGLVQGALAVGLGVAWRRQGLLVLGTGSLVLQVGTVMAVSRRHGVWGKSAMLVGLGVALLSWSLWMERRSARDSAAE